MNWQLFGWAGFGVVAGMTGAVCGLGGGFLIVPMLLFLGYSAPRSAGTAMLAVTLSALSALIAHARLQNVDFAVGLWIGIGGLLGAQMGAHLVEHVSTGNFRRMFAVLLAGVAVSLWIKA